jgi:hypothetical protein
MILLRIPRTGTKKEGWGAAADPTDDDEQPDVPTSQPVPGFGIISRRPSSRLGTHTREAYRRSCISRNIHMFPPSPFPLPPSFILAPEVHGHFGWIKIKIK